MRDEAPATAGATGRGAPPGTTADGLPDEGREGRMSRDRRAGTDAAETAAGRPARGRRRRRAAVAGVVVLGLVAATAVALVGLRGVAGTALADLQRLTGVVTPGAGASEGDGRPLDGPFLLVGSDARGDAQVEGDGDWVPGAQRSDVMVLGRVTPAGEVLLVSLPRDLWVDVPDHGPAKLNAAYSWGGPSLLVRTLAQETGVEVQHYAAIDFAGITDLTDAVGGVTVHNPVAMTAQGVPVAEGEVTLDGPTALAYLRERRSLPRGDLDRIANQQRYLLALFDEVLSPDTLADPRRARAVLGVVREHVAVDDATGAADLEALARALGTTPGEDVVAVTVPVAGDGTEQGQSVLHVDETGAAAVWAAFAAGDAEALRAAAG